MTVIAMLVGVAIFDALALKFAAEQRPGFSD
jgi:hypothetical protein